MRTYAYFSVTYGMTRAGTMADRWGLLQDDEYGPKLMEGLGSFRSRSSPNDPKPPESRRPWYLALAASAALLA